MRRSSSTRAERTMASPGVASIAAFLDSGFSRVVLTVMALESELYTEDFRVSAQISSERAVSTG